MNVAKKQENSFSSEVIQDHLHRLEGVLKQIGSVAIAVSGGVDSTLLAVIAGRMSDLQVEMFHAISPAVPERATKRVREHALSENWNFTAMDAGEFEDERYMLNPYNRCFFCKTNLYSEIAKHTDNQILSGTNLDDLDDFRPGLKAAEEHAVRHPYVEANIDKSVIRAIADFLNLKDLAELPASPCLSSRVQTGTPIDADCLKAIDQVEIAIKQRLQADIVRCRVRRREIVIELDPEALDQINAEKSLVIAELIDKGFPGSYSRSVRFEPYKMGSAFIQLSH